MWHLGWEIPPPLLWFWTSVPAAGRSKQLESPSHLSLTCFICFFHLLVSSIYLFHLLVHQRNFEHILLRSQWKLPWHTFKAYASSPGKGPHVSQFGGGTDLDHSWPISTVFFVESREMFHGEIAPAAGTAGPSRVAPRTWWHWWRYDH